MKIAISVLLVLLLGSGVFNYQLSRQSDLQDQQLVSYERQVRELMTRIEENSVDRLHYEQQVQQLQSEFNTLNSQLTVLSAQLQASGERADPDYAQLETEIRQRIRRENAVAANSATPSRLQLIRQLSAMDPAEMGEIMTLQGQYGDFLEQLDVDEQRLEVIVDSLSNMIAEQSQARTEVIMEMGRQNLDPELLGQRMFAISSLQNQLDTMALVLTEEELALFELNQSNKAMAGQTAIRAIVNTGDDPDNPSLFFSSGSIEDLNPANGVLQGGSGSGRAIRVEVIETGIDN